VKLNATITKQVIEKLSANLRVHKFTNGFRAKNFY